MQWVSASKPVAAVTAGGRPKVSSGSARTSGARSFGSKMIFLACVLSSETTERAADLAARAGGGRHGDHERDRLVDRPRVGLAVLVVEELARVVDHQRDRLAHVERRAAAEDDDAVGAVLVERGDAAFDLALGRIAEDAGVDRRDQAGRDSAAVRSVIMRQRRRGPCR